jgi:hypothetical protein
MIASSFLARVSQRQQRTSVHFSPHPRFSLNRKLF